MRVGRYAWTLVVVAIVLAACGGGGDPGAGPQIPAAVTVSVAAAAGRTVDVDLADGASATLVFPADAFASDQSVTITPLAVQSGDWTRFSIVPGIARMRAPLTLRVRAPASVRASDVPVLQLVTADGPLLLRTTLLADGRLEAVLPPLLDTPDAAAASVGRAKALAAARPLADGDDGTTVAGTGFVAFCEVPQATIADARRVILNASRASQVNTALSTLAMLHERCGAGAAGALDAFTAEIPGLYAQALSDWQAVNYIEVEGQLETFRRGVRRVLALCAAAQQLGSALTCPLTVDFEGQYAEIADGFAAAAGERENSGSLRVLFEQLLPLPAEAELFGRPQAVPALRSTLALIADRLMDRAYALCNGAELFEWRIYVESGGPSRRSGETLRRGMAYCSIALSAGFDPENDSAQFVPGSLDGVGRVAERTLSGPFDSHLLPLIAGTATHCSRVIGTPAGNEPLIVRVSTKTIVEIPALGEEHDYVGGVLQFDIPFILATIGRPADSTDPIRIDIFRGAVALPGCTDSRGDPLTISAPEALLYSLTLKRQPLDVSLTMPATLSGATTITVQARDPATDTPAAGAAVSFSVTGGSVSSGGVTNAEGQLSATLTPVFGQASVTVTADVRATNGTRGSATATSVVELPRRWAGSISMTHTSFRDGIFIDVVATTVISATRSVELEFAPGQESKFFTITGQSGTATQRSTTTIVADEDCTSDVQTLEGPVVRHPTEIPPELLLGADGTYRIKFGSVLLLLSGTTVTACSSGTKTTVIPPTLFGSTNQAEPEQFFSVLVDGTLQGSSTRVVRATDAAAFNETTRTVTWSLVPR